MLLALFTDLEVSYSSSCSQKTSNKTFKRTLNYSLKNQIEKLIYKNFRRSYDSLKDFFHLGKTGFC